MKKPTKFNMNSNLNHLRNIFFSTGNEISFKKQALFRYLKLNKYSHIRITHKKHHFLHRQKNIRIIANCIAVSNLTLMWV